MNNINTHGSKSSSSSIKKPQQQQQEDPKQRDERPLLSRSTSQPQIPIHTIVKQLHSNNTPQSLAIPTDIPNSTPNVKELGKVFETNNSSGGGGASGRPSSGEGSKSNSPLMGNKKNKFQTEKTPSTHSAKPIPESFYTPNSKKQDLISGSAGETATPEKKQKIVPELPLSGISAALSASSSSMSPVGRGGDVGEATSPTSGDETRVISPRNKNNRNAGDWKEKTMFTQGSVAKLDRGRSKKLLIGNGRETPPSSPLAQSVPTSPVISSSPPNASVEEDVKYLEKKYHNKKSFISNRKSVMSKQDAEWIEKNFTGPSSPPLSPSSAGSGSPSGGYGDMAKSGPGYLMYRESIRHGKGKDMALSIAGDTNPLGASDRGDDIDIYESPCFRFIEEVGKKKSVSAEPCRRPGIKTPMFLNVPTLAMPTQFHQTPPERLSSNNFSVPVEENFFPDSALLFNQQIINRASYDKELSYLFFPVLKSSQQVSQSNPQQTALTNGQQVIQQKSNSAGQSTASSKSNQSQQVTTPYGSNSSTSPNISGGGSSCDLYSLSPTPSSSPISPSPPLYSDSPPTATNSSSSSTTPTTPINPIPVALKENNRKSYLPSFGKKNNNNNNNSNPPLSPFSLSMSPSGPLPPTPLDSSDNDSNTSANNSPTNPTQIPPVPPPPPATPTPPASSNQIDISKVVSEEFKDRADMIFCQVGNIRNRYKLKSSSLDGLIDLITHHKFSEPDFVDTFLYTYKTFTSSSVVLAKLIEKYEYSPPTQTITTDEEREAHEQLLEQLRTVKLRVVSILKIWVDKHFTDFEKNEEILEEIIGFIEGPLVEDGMEKVAETILKTIERKRATTSYVSNLMSEDEQAAREKNVIHFKVPPPIIPQIIKSDQIINIHLFDDLEIARQLTLIEHEAYSLVKPSECINLAFSKPGKEENAPNIVAIIRRSNLIPQWVATEIVQEERLTKRSNIIKKFINIADHCRNLNNFNAVMEILSGLNLTPVYRLKKTWETLPRKYLATFKHLNSLMAPKNNFKVYREILHTKNPPCLPFLGLYLTDLTFTEEGTPDIIDNGLINMVKRSSQASIIRELQQFQKIPYSFTPVPAIRDFLLQINGLQERALYKQSKYVEA